MTSVQRNEGKATHANPATTIEQTVNSGSTQQTNGQSPTDPFANNPHRQYWQEQYQLNVAECQKCLAGYADIHEVVDRFVSEMHSIDNLEVLNDLFFAWNSRKRNKNDKQHHRHITYNFLRITAFLTQLHELWTTKLRLDELNTINAERGASHEE